MRRRTIRHVVWGQKGKKKDKRLKEMREEKGHKRSRRKRKVVIHISKKAVK